jgi:hypothetical protein
MEPYIENGIDDLLSVKLENYPKEAVSAGVLRPQVKE